LARQGYRVNAATLHAMQRKGYLEFQTEQASRSQRRLYRATPYGIKSLAQAQEKIRELFHEVGPKNEGS
tara:strand:- start:2337 stop:2543 length:207 start_codon:yes stop_codon:yes gene_type:complete